MVPEAKRSNDRQSEPGCSFHVEQFVTHINQSYICLSRSRIRTSIFIVCSLYIIEFVDFFVCTVVKQVAGRCHPQWGKRTRTQTNYPDSQYPM